MVICQCSVSEIGPLWFYVLFCGGSTCKEGSCCSRLTEMTEKQCAELLWVPAGPAGTGGWTSRPRSLRAHPELCSVKGNRNSFLTFPAGAHHRPPPAVRSASPPSALTHPSQRANLANSPSCTTPACPKASFCPGETSFHLDALCYVSQPGLQSFLKSLRQRLLWS